MRGLESKNATTLDGRQKAPLPVCNGCSIYVHVHVCIHVSVYKIYSLIFCLLQHCKCVYFKSTKLDSSCPHPHPPILYALFCVTSQVVFGLVVVVSALIEEAPRDFDNELLHCRLHCIGVIE